MPMLRFQLSRMVRSREYRVALLLSSLCVCAAFLYEANAASALDRSQILSASEVACGYGLSYGWGLFSALWPFLVVLPFATSFISDRKEQCIAPAVTRSSYPAYFRGKLLASAIGSATVVLLPMLLNLALCYLVFPVNHNLILSGYEDHMYPIILLGQNKMYRSVSDGYPFLRLYLFSPLLHQLLYLFLLGGFSGLCGAAVAALSFRLPRWKLTLFLPLYAVLVLTLRLRTIFLDAAARGEITFLDPYWPNYLAPMASNNVSIWYAGGICGLLVLFCLLTLRWAGRRELDALQG